MNDATTESQGTNRATASAVSNGAPQGVASAKYPCPVRGFIGSNADERQLCGDYLCDEHTTDAVQTAAQIVPDRVTCETILEVARACKTLLDAVETVDVEVTDPVTLERVTRRMSRIALLFRVVPEVLDPRRIVCLGDMCADHPDWWRSNRLHFFCPELTIRDIAEILELRPHQVRDAVLKAEIPEDCYDNLPQI